MEVADLVRGVEANRRLETGGVVAVPVGAL